jgi:hypothetical protein
MQLPQLYLIKGFLIAKEAPDEIMVAVNALLEYPNQDDLAEESVEEIEVESDDDFNFSPPNNELIQTVKLQNEVAANITVEDVIKKEMQIEIDEIEDEHVAENDTDDIEEVIEKPKTHTGGWGRIPDSDLDYVKGEVENGRSMAAIGKEYEVSGQTVTNFLVKHDAYHPKKRNGAAQVLQQAVERTTPVEKSQTPFVDVPIEKLQTVHDEYAGKRDPDQSLDDSDWPDIQAMTRKGMTFRQIASDYDVKPPVMREFIDQKLIEEARKKDAHRRNPQF